MNKTTVKRHLRNFGLERLRWKTKADNVRRSGQRVRDCAEYVLTDPEIDNFTYDIGNKDELAEWLDEVCGGGHFLSELENDSALRRELDRQTRRRPSVKTPMFFGRRLGWYAIVRATKPDIVVETGTHDGLGSTALLAALERNGTGRLLSIDPRPGTGWLVPENLRARWTRIEATSYDALPDIQDVDMFIHDSLHTAEVERWELETATSVGASILLSDNAHKLPTLRDYAAEIGADFALWHEQPLGHFYGGASLGIAQRG